MRLPWSACLAEGSYYPMRRSRAHPMTGQRVEDEDDWQPQAWRPPR